MINKGSYLKTVPTMNRMAASTPELTWLIRSATPLAFLRHATTVDVANDIINVATSQSPCVLSQVSREACPSIRTLKNLQSHGNCRINHTAVQPPDRGWCLERRPPCRRPSSDCPR